MTELPPSRTAVDDAPRLGREVEDSARDRLLCGRRGEDPPVGEDVQIGVERQPELAPVTVDQLLVAGSKISGAATMPVCGAPGSHSPGSRSSQTRRACARREAG